MLANMLRHFGSGQLLGLEYIRTEKANFDYVTCEEAATTAVGQLPRLRACVCGRRCQRHASVCSGAEFALNSLVNFRIYKDSLWPLLGAKSSRRARRQAGSKIVGRRGADKNVACWLSDETR